MKLSKNLIQKIAGSDIGGSAVFSGGSVGVTKSYVEENYISKAFFDRLFTIHGTVTEIDPETEEEITTEVVIHPNDISTTLSNIEAKKGLWTNEFMSALGINSGGGGGGTVLLEPLASINNAGLADHPSVAGQAVVWNGSAWVYGSTGGSGTVTSVAITTPSSSHLYVNGGNSASISASGTFALSFESGYGIPKTADVSKGVTAYGWGDHATQGYLQSVAFSDLTSHPTTLSGYGITDAKISGGTITLGSNTITPWTGSNHPTTLSGYGITDAKFGTASGTTRPITLGSVTQNVLIAHQSLSGYATQSWVQSQGYLTDAMKNFVSESSDLNSLTDSGSYRLGTGNTNKPSDDNYAQLLVVSGGGDTAAQIFFPYGRSTAYLRNGNPLNATGSWRGWKEMAFTDSNVASATKLQNARLIWGNSFDGTANVGDSTTRKGLSYVSNIMMTGSIGSDSGDHLQNIYMTYFIYGPRGIEMNKYGGESGNGGFIDFHYAGSSADYTARIIEDSTNVVSLYAKNSSGTIVAPTFQVGPGNYAASLRIGNGMIVWDTTNNALKVQKADGTAANLVALGGVSALGFQAGSSSTSITNLTVTNRLTIQDGGTIASDGELFIGNVSNDATIYVNDIGSMMDYDLWHIGAETGYATFARTYCPRFYFDNTRYLQYSGGHLQFYNGSSFVNLT